MGGSNNTGLSRGHLYHALSSGRLSLAGRKTCRQTCDSSEGTCSVRSVMNLRCVSLLSLCLCCTETPSSAPVLWVPLLSSQAQETKTGRRQRNIHTWKRWIRQNGHGDGWWRRMMETDAVSRTDRLSLLSGPISYSGLTICFCLLFLTWKQTKTHVYTQVRTQHTVTISY